MKKIFIISIFAFGIFFALAENAQAGEFYASPTASAGGDGTKASPWRIADIAWTTIDNTESTLYLFGGTYAPYDIYGDPISMRVAHNTTANTLTIRPCSASSDPMGCDGRVIFTGRIDLAEHVELSGEKTIGACSDKALNDTDCRWIRMIGHGAAITDNDAAAQIIKIKYLEISGVWGQSGAYPITMDDAGCSYPEIAYNYIHGCRGAATINVQSRVQAYGACQIHHNYMENDALDYLTRPIGCDVYNNYFDTLALNGNCANEDACSKNEPDDNNYQLYDVVHSFFGPDYGDTNGKVWERFYNNDFIGAAEQTIFFENQFTVSSSANKTQNVRVFNNVFDAYRVSQPPHQGGIQGIVIKNQLAVTGVDDFAIFNNTFSHFDAPTTGSTPTPTGTAIQIRGAASPVFTRFVVENNIFYHNDEDIGTPSAKLAQDPGNYFGAFNAETDGVLDYNFFSAPAVHFGWRGTTANSIKWYTSLSSFNTEHPTYSHNISSTINPLFTSVANSAQTQGTSNFHLLAGSLAIDSGKDLSAIAGMPTGWPFDKGGTARSGSWEMGPYEYGFTCTTPGDFTCNGYSISDLQTMISIILGTDTTTSYTQADMSTPPDGLVNISDLQLLIKKVLGIN